MRSRLESIAPELDSALRATDPKKADRAAFAAAHLASDACALSEVAAGIAFTPENLPAIDALVVALDGEYFSLYELSESGHVPESSYLLPFTRARAACAMALALRGESYEAVYEAIIATNDIPSIALTVSNALLPEA